MNRRNYLKNAALLAGGFFAKKNLFGFSGKQKPSIVLRSSWQTVNIGDIAHTPGVLALLEKYLPEAEVRLWPSDVGSGVEEMLHRRFPRVSIMKTREETERCFEECDFMLHGSGPSLVAGKDLYRWHEQTGKPYGIYGITFPGVYDLPPASARVDPLDIELLGNARFAYFRDSVSLEFAKMHGARCPVMEFGPDGAFAVDVRNDQAAVRFLKEHDLQEGRFLCVISHLRFTPYWTIPGKNVPFNEAKHARNEQMKEHDNAPIREAIVEVVRKTPLKILIVPENETQVRIGKEMLYDPLPADVKEKVVWRDRFWLTDEALSTYLRSAGLFGLEMHSPIMCVGNGIPAIVCRYAEQTSKGFMWRDIGLGDWLFDMDVEKEVAGIVPAVLDMAESPDGAKAKAEKAREFVEERQLETMRVLKEELT